MRSLARENGYGISVCHSHKNNPTRPNSIQEYVDTKRERGGSYRLQNPIADRLPIRPNTRTKLIQCPFRVKLNLRGTNWTVHTVKTSIVMVLRPALYPAHAIVVRTFPLFAATLIVHGKLESRLRMHSSKPRRSILVSWPSKLSTCTMSIPDDEF